MAKHVKRFKVRSQGPMLTPDELRRQAEYFRKRPGENAQRTAELAEMAACAQERPRNEFTPEEVAEITGGESSE